MIFDIPTGKQSGMRFSLDPDSDPTCNGGDIKLFHLGAKYEPESTMKLKIMVYKIEFYAYLPNI